jgi:hypothetical protein
MVTKLQIDMAKFQRYPDLDGGDDEETALLLPMAEKALGYVRGFHWAPPIRDIHLAFGIGEIIALFLIRFEWPVEGISTKSSGSWWATCPRPTS